MNIKLPTFLIIGAARSGTTTLFEGLRYHPDIFLPQNKRPEPHFFLKPDEYGKGLGYYSDRYFSDWYFEPHAGEASSSYLFHPDVPQRIYRDLPKVKLIVILRDPIERAYSNYKVSKENGLESLSFDEAIRREAYRTNHPESDFHRVVQPYAYVGRSLYYTHLMRYMQYFHRDQCLVLFFETLRTQPLAVFESVFRFLGVDEYFHDLVMFEAHNPSRIKTDPISDETRDYLRSLFDPEMRRLEEWLEMELPWQENASLCHHE